MIKKALKAAAWTTAPKAMFATKHPRKAALARAAQWTAQRVGAAPRRRGPSAGQVAARGLAAAALALPIGLWLGRRGRGERTAEAAS